MTDENYDDSVVVDKTKTPKVEPKIKTYFKTKKNRTRFLTRVGMFSALASVFYMWLKFPLPFFPNFLDINFSNLFILIGSLITGPVGGIIIIIIRFILKIMIMPTSTAFVGELTDVLLSLCIMLPASIIYDVKRTKIGGFVGIILSYISWIGSSMLINYSISLPLYINLYCDGSIEKLVGWLSETLPSINTSNYMNIYIFGAVLPFNALLGFVNCGLAFIVYKKISILLKKIGI